MLYLEDLKVGDTFHSETYTLGEEEIKTFASQYDPQPFHLDAEAAKTSLFGGLVASGWHTAAVTMRLFVTGGLPLANGMIGTGGEISWPRPTWPGDTLQVHTTLLDIAPSRSKPDRGTITVRSETRNQNGEPVQILVVKVIVFRKPATT
ncbi:MAG: MaoC family dehydratase [Pseudohongiellaceae bacterium]